MSGPPPVPKKKPTILVAEDDTALRKMIGHLLAETANVIAACDGMEALSMLRAMPRMPDLVITDLMMPRLDGLGLLRQLRSTKDGKNVPIIILTAKTRPTDVVMGINAGARHYLVKPFKRDELLEKVRSVLRL